MYSGPAQSRRVFTNSKSHLRIHGCHHDLGLKKYSHGYGKIPTGYGNFYDLTLTKIIWKNDGKSPCSMGKITISMAIFNSLPSGYD